MYQKKMPRMPICFVVSFLYRMKMAVASARAGIVTPAMTPLTVAMTLPTKSGTSLKRPPAALYADPASIENSRVGHQPSGFSLPPPGMPTRSSTVSTTARPTGPRVPNTLFTRGPLRVGGVQEDADDGGGDGDRAGG